MLDILVWLPVYCRPFLGQNKKSVCLPSPDRPAKIGPSQKILLSFPSAFFFRFSWFFVSLEIFRKPIHIFIITTTLWLAPAFIDTWDLLRCIDRAPYDIEFHFCSGSAVWRVIFHKLCLKDPSYFGGVRWLSGRVSDSGARGRGFETYRRRVVSLSKTLYSPKVLVNYPGSGGSVPIWLKNCWLGR